MKNYLLLTASAVLVLSSCSNNEIVENKELKNGEPTKMSISAYVPGMTRGLYEAVETTEAMFKEAGFALVTDQFDDEGLMFRTQMAFNSENSVWGSAAGAAKPEWPSDPAEEVQFYGVYPSEAIGDLGLKSLGDDEYALPIEEGGSATTDLMVAYTSSSLASSGNGSGNGEVRLDFSHVLAKVEIKFIGAQEGYNYEVGKVELTAPKATEYRFNTASFTSESDSIYKLDEITGISIGEFQIKGVNVDGNEVTTAEAVDYGELMVVPGQCTLNLGYRIALPDQSVEAKETTSQNQITFTAQAGRRNVVIVTLAPSAKAMSFTVYVTGWTDGDTTEPTIEL